MTRVVLAGVLFTAGFAGPLLADDATAAALAGSYTVVGLNKDGKDLPAAEFEGFRAKIAKDELTFTVKGKDFPAKLKLDATKTPARLDLSPSDGPDKGRTFPGIFAREKGDLVLAFTESADRPADFTGAADVLVVRLRKADGK